MIYHVRNFLIDLITQKKVARLRNAFDSLYSKRTPLFYQVHLETCSFCNNDCEFCPANKNYDKRGLNFMDFEIIELLIKNLTEIGFNGLISIFNNNEPLIDKRLPKIVALLSEKLPNARTEIYTNGKLLTFDLAQELWDKGLDSLVIDCYYTSKADKNKLASFCKQYRNSQYSKSRNITINYINKNIKRTNRGGEAPNLNKSKNNGNNKFCVYPFMQLNVNYRGDIHLCCNDVYYKEIIGNIKENSIVNIWNKAAYKNIRKKLLKENRNFGICKSCNCIPVLLNADEILYQNENKQIGIVNFVKNNVKHTFLDYNENYKL